MTDPTDQPANPADLPSVDSVIHDAREESWQLPQDAPHPVATPEDHGEAASAADAAATPRPAPAATPAAAPVAPVTPAAPTTTAAPTAGHAAPTDTHAAPAHAAPAAHGSAAAHGVAAGHGNGHDAHDEEKLGPVDMEMWGAGILAAAVGLFIAVCFVLATSGAGAY